MAGPFETALAVVLEAEGGYTDDARDPGGKTRYGITEEVARSHGYTGEMCDLPLDTAKAIYRKDYWDVCKCDNLPWPLSLYVFDAAVNQGCNPAIRMLQTTLDVPADGLIGERTLTAAIRRGGGETPALYMAARAQRYTGTRNFDRFGRGWLKRLFVVTAAGATAKLE